MEKVTSFLVRKLIIKLHKAHAQTLTTNWAKVFFPLHLYKTLALKIAKTSCFINVNVLVVIKYLFFYIRQSKKKHLVLSDSSKNMWENWLKKKHQAAPTWAVMSISLGNLSFLPSSVFRKSNKLPRISLMKKNH